jgi:hypothetical protein
MCRLLPHSTRPSPNLWVGRHPHCPFRGLLRLHSRYGPHARSTAQGGLCHGASAEPVTRPRRPSATSSIDNSLGGTLLHRCFAPSRRTRGSRHAGGPRPALGNCKLAGRQYLRLRTSSPGAACYSKREPDKSCNTRQIDINRAGCVPALGQMMRESINVGRQLAIKKPVCRIAVKPSRRVHCDLLKRGRHFRNTG